MANRIGRWCHSLLCLAVLYGCVPYPVYHTRGDRPKRIASADLPAAPVGRKEAEKERALPPPQAKRPITVRRTEKKSPPVVNPPTDAHPLDLQKIDTRKAYQIGIASYYGEKFHGRKTANGEVFNMYKLTAAHRVLPLGTRIKVTNLSNGRWVVVKVNDRGPFVEGRVLDLSFAAALELEMVKAGTAKVMIEIVEKVD